MKNAIISLVAIAIIIGVRVIAAGPSIEKQLKKECEQLNKTCPKKLNRDLRLDKVTANGKVMSAQAGKRHGMIKRSNKFIRDARGMTVLAEPDQRIIKKMAPYGLK